MPSKPRTIAVTGLNATDNPAPGIGVIRSLRAPGAPGDSVVGLAYDALDPGVYADDIVEDVFLLPYPSSNVEAFLARIAQVHDAVGLDVIIPTLDAELPTFIALEARLARMGIAMLLPSREQLDLRSKANLERLGRRADIDVPRSLVITSPAELLSVQDQINYPFLVKGVFYGATLVTCFDEAAAAFHKVAAQWGLPVIVQERVSGEELNVIGLGDGEGNLCGAVPMKKLVLTDKGKASAGITIADPDLVAVAERFVRATHWRGPFEVEVILDRQGRYQLLEINPRFPAWVHLATAAGINLPCAVVELALGGSAPRLREYAVGTMFVRISIDQIATITDLDRILTSGEIRRSEPVASARGISSVA